MIASANAVPQFTVRNPETKLSPKRRIQMVYQSMRRRCHVPGTQFYATYGGRGIAVCQEWLDCPAAFTEWALRGWAPGLELDRVDNDGPYAPNNCRWVSSKEQNRNRRTTRRVVYQGVTMTLPAAVDAAFPGNEARMLNLIHSRLTRGMSMEEAFSKPVRQRGK